MLTGTRHNYIAFLSCFRVTRSKLSRTQGNEVAVPRIRFITVTSLLQNEYIYLLVQYIPRNMHTVFALLCFDVVIHWLIFPYPSGLLHWHCGNLTIAPVAAKQPWWIWINTSCEFIRNDCITTTKQSTTKPCAYFLRYTVCMEWGDMVRIFVCVHDIQYIPRKMHTVLLCFALLWLRNRS